MNQRTTTSSHPRGLYFLFFVELWERFSYYGMRAILVLYLTATTVEGGLGWEMAESLSLYGTYTGLVYLTPLIGGYIADHFLGQRRAIVLGGGLMVLGHFLMAYQVDWAFYTALGLIIAGNGFFKPNIATMVGGLYKEGDPRRDAGFTIFYMGVNAGAFLAPLVCGWLAQEYGWHYGFAAAGVGMVIGQIAFMLAARAGVFGQLGVDPGEKVSKRAGNGLKPEKGLSKEETDRVAVIFTLAVFVIFFWAGFEQAGGYMNLYAQDFTDRVLFGWEVPAAWFQSLNPLFIVLLGPVMSELWIRMGQRGKDPVTPVKMATGLFLLGFGFLFMIGSALQQGDAEVARASMMWLVLTYLFHTVGELCLSPVGLSMVTKLAPVQYAAMLMGTWYLSNAAANKLACFVGAMLGEIGPITLFGTLAGVVIFISFVLFALAKKLAWMMHGKG